MTTQAEAVKVLRSQFERQKAEKYKPEVSRGLHLKNADGSFQVSSIEQEFQAWAEGYRTALAATSQVEAATSEAVARITELEAALVQRNSSAHRECEKLVSHIHRLEAALWKMGAPGEAALAAIRAAPLALPATEQASYPTPEWVQGMIERAQNIPASLSTQPAVSLTALQVAWIIGQAQAAQAKPDLSGLTEGIAALRHWFETQRKAISKKCGSSWDIGQCDEQIEFIDALLAHPVAQAKPEGGGL